MCSAIEKACNLVKGQTELARLLNEHGVKVTVQAVNKWVRKKRVPPQRVLMIEKITKGKVSCHDLRPDIYPKK